MTKSFSLGSQVTLSMLSKKQDLIDFAMINNVLVKPIPFVNILNQIIVFPLVGGASGKCGYKTLS